MCDVLFCVAKLLVLLCMSDKAVCDFLPMVVKLRVMIGQAAKLCVMFDQAAKLF